VPYATCSVKDGDILQRSDSAGFEGREVVCGADWKGCLAFRSPNQVTSCGNCTTDSCKPGATALRNEAIALARWASR
jgi:hypothetical protein